MFIFWNAKISRRFERGAGDKFPLLLPINSGAECARIRSDFYSSNFEFCCFPFFFHIYCITIRLSKLWVLNHLEFINTAFGKVVATTTKIISKTYFTCKIKTVKCKKKKRFDVFAFHRIGTWHFLKLSLKMVVISYLIYSAFQWNLHTVFYCNTLASLLWETTESNGGFVHGAQDRERHTLFTR